MDAIWLEMEHEHTIGTHIALFFQIEWQEYIGIRNTTIEINWVDCNFFFLVETRFYWLLIEIGELEVIQREY